MQESDGIGSLENPDDRAAASPSSAVEIAGSDDDSVIDVSRKCLEFPLLRRSNSSARDLYLYKNEFNLLPSWAGQLRGLRTLKFFANEVNLFPAEFSDLVSLERLQVKIPPPGLERIALHKLKDLKELELSKVLRRPCVFPLMSEIAQLKCLTKLSVCHFSIRCLPPEIGCLNKLEYLDLSFNKMKSLPNEITSLSSLISLKVSHNKLMELPCDLPSLQRLESLDLSNNRLTSLGSLEFGTMPSLRSINLQFNRLLYCQVPSSICCQLDGNDNKVPIEDCSSSSVEMDVYESSTKLQGGILPHKGSCHSSASLLSVSSLSSRSFSARSSSKKWKRRHYLQQKARQECLNNSRKWKSEMHTKDLAMNSAENNELQDEDILVPNIQIDRTSEIGTCKDDADKALLSGEVVTENLLDNVVEEKISLKYDIPIENSSPESKCGSTVEDHNCCKDSTAVSSGSYKQDLLKQEANTKTKRPCDKTPENPKPCKYRRSTDDHVKVSSKYSSMSFCGVGDLLPDGFYDAGRDRPFLSLGSYEQNLHLDSREVILMDRGKDEVLDAITISAQSLVFRVKSLKCLTKDEDNAAFDNLHIVSLLALFVSDHFGGCDRTSIVEGMRKSVSGSNYRKPFVCTCSTGNGDGIGTHMQKHFCYNEDISFTDLCEKSLYSIKVGRNSIVVPIGALRFGVCRHRSLLLKYLCDRMKPPVPCELVRGYLDFLPHAWNVVLIPKGKSLIRMVVDACRPHDIREETDPEYLSRYIPLCRCKIPMSMETATDDGSFPSLPTFDEISEASTSSGCFTYGSTCVFAKVRTSEVGCNSFDDIRNFEYRCLGEVRLLGVLEHPCIVKMVGHHIYSKWINGVDGNPQRRVLVSTILMEHIKGGSLKNYLKKLSESGDKHVPVKLALIIAEGVASALVELHSKHIIHRDVKSENVLVDLESGQPSGTPVVKLCDFDQAVPLMSSSHTCCIAHTGIHSPNVCVGTPRWMAPEVLQAMEKPKHYGLEADIWSYGCLLLELLTLQIPYSGMSDSLMHDLLQNGERPKLTDEMEALTSSRDHSSSGSEDEKKRMKQKQESLRFLVDLFYKCTQKHPGDRPSAREIYESLLSHTKNLVLEPDLEQE
ncbi:hypothetical protein SAY86_022572 [Trapa natans]|uniref:Protein kinase domain-containing protein n=1 Tax=Trapa natans TaxID=22666 RepID=A0AAN7R741_TRANT|nr:hypothetical protein SAY86_022572 [Trapa natans]